MSISHKTDDVYGTYLLNFLMPNSGIPKKMYSQEKHILGQILINVHCKGSLIKTAGLIVYGSSCDPEVDIMPKAKQPHLLLVPILLLKTEWTKTINKQWFIGELSTEINLFNNL